MLLGHAGLPPPRPRRAFPVTPQSEQAFPANTGEPGVQGSEGYKCLPARLPRYGRQSVVSVRRPSMWFKSNLQANWASWPGTAVAICPGSAGLDSQGLRVSPAIKSK